MTGLTIIICMLYPVPLILGFFLAPLIYRATRHSFYKTERFCIFIPALNWVFLIGGLLDVCKVFMDKVWAVLYGEPLD